MKNSSNLSKKEQEKEYPKVAIIILNWNEWRDTIECLESVYQIDYPNYEIVVVDNGSNDNSIEKIKKYADGKITPKSEYFEYKNKNKPIEVFETTKEESEKKIIYPRKFENHPSNQKMILLKNRRNYGFAKGNNIAIKFASDFLDPDYFLLLNNDTVVCMEFLNKLIESGERFNRKCCLNPRINFYDNPKITQVLGWNLTQKYGFLKPERPRTLPTKDNFSSVLKVDLLSGCCLLIPSKVIDRLGLLRKDFFLYAEDFEYSLRAKRLGFLNLVDPSSVVYHKGSKSADKFSDIKKEYFASKNRFMIDTEYFGASRALLNFTLRSVRMMKSDFLSGDIKEIFPLLQTCFRALIKAVQSD